MTAQGVAIPPPPLGMTYYLGEYRRHGVRYNVDVWARSWQDAEVVLSEQHPEAVIIGTHEGIVPVNTPEWEG